VRREAEEKAKQAQVSRGPCMRGGYTVRAECSQLKTGEATTYGRGAQESRRGAREGGAGGGCAMHHLGLTLQREEKAKTKGGQQRPPSPALPAAAPAVPSRIGPRLTKQRPASPPIPALRGPRAPSPPIPTLRKDVCHWFLLSLFALSLNRCDCLHYFFRLPELPREKRSGISHLLAVAGLIDREPVPETKEPARRPPSARAPLPSAPAPTPAPTPAPSARTAPLPAPSPAPDPSAQR